MNSIFSENLKKARKHNNLTQRQVAEFTNLSQGAVGAYEEGRAEPSNVNLINICELLRVTNVRQFLTDESFDPSNQDKSVVHPVSIFEKKYNELPERQKQIVNMLMGIK